MFLVEGKIEVYGEVEGKSDEEMEVWINSITEDMDPSLEAVGARLRERHPELTVNVIT